MAGIGGFFLAPAIMGIIVGIYQVRREEMANPEDSMKFYIETYGCTANLGKLAGSGRALQEMGHISSSLDEADAVIVNTCAVTEKTERKILRRLSLLQGERLVVAGCLPVALPESISGISCRERLGLLNRSAAARISDLFDESFITISG